MTGVLAGAAAGMVLRNAMAAIVVAFVLQLAVQVVLTFVARDTCVPPVVARFDVADQNLFIPSGKLLDPDDHDAHTPGHRGGPPVDHSPGGVSRIDVRTARWSLKGR